MPVTVDLLDSVNQKYDNTTSGLTATNAKTALDELAAEKVQTPDAAGDGSTNITHMVGLTQDEYNGITTPNANTLYVIVG